MSYHAEYEKKNADIPILSNVVDKLLSFLPGETNSDYYECTLIDDDSGDVLATGSGDTRDEALSDAESNL